MLKSINFNSTLAIALLFTVLGCNAKTQVKEASVYVVKQLRVDGRVVNTKEAIQLSKNCDLSLLIEVNPGISSGAAVVNVCKQIEGNLVSLTGAGFITKQKGNEVSIETPFEIDRFDGVAKLIFGLSFRSAQSVQNQSIEFDCVFKD